MAKKSRATGGILSSLWSLIAWLTGILVSLAVGFGMIGKTLEIPLISNVGNGVIVTTAGYIVVILALLGVLLKIIDKIGS